MYDGYYVSFVMVIIIYYEYGPFIIGQFFHDSTPSIWACFKTPYSHILVRVREFDEEEGEEEA